MALTLVTAPTQFPISLQEAKEQCRVLHADEDAHIASLIEAATSVVDNHNGWLGQAMVSQTWRLTYDAFPCDGLQIPLGPLIGVGSVEYIHPTTLVLTTWSSANYTVDTESKPGWVIANDAWPATADAANAVRVTFTAGFGTPDKVPAAIRHAIKMLVGYWYDTREAVGQPIEEAPLGVKALLAPFRRYML